MPFELPPITEIGAIRLRVIANQVDLATCDYFRGTGSCSASGGLCALLGEPLCHTDRPAEGWPSEHVGGA
jgi:hypothetical protein